MSLNAARRRFLTQAGGWAGRWVLVGTAGLALSAAPASAQMDDLIRQKPRSGGTQPQGGVQGPEPAAIVRQIFETYRADKIPSVPWSPAVRARMRSADLGADPILQAQDIEVKQFTVRQISRAHDRASVEVRFLSFDRNMRSIFDFRAVDGRWTIANYRILAGTEFPSDFRKSLKLPPLK